METFGLLLPTAAPDYYQPRLKAEQAHECQQSLRKICYVLFRPLVRRVERLYKRSKAAAWHLSKRWLDARSTT